MEATEPLPASSRPAPPDNVFQCHQALIGQARLRLGLNGCKLNYAYGLCRAPSEEGIYKLFECMKENLRRMENPIRVAIDPARLKNLEAIQANKVVTSRWSTSLEAELSPDDSDPIDVMAGQLRLIVLRKLCSMGPFTLEKDGWWWCEFYSAPILANPNMAHILQILCTNSENFHVEMGDMDKWSHAMYLMERKEAATDEHTRRELDRLVVDEIGASSSMNRLFQVAHLRPFIHNYVRVYDSHVSWKSLLEIMRSDLAAYHLHHMDRFTTTFLPLLEAELWLAPGRQGKKRNSKQRPSCLKEALGSSFKEASLAAYECMLRGGGVEDQQKALRDALMQSKKLGVEDYPPAFWEAVDSILDGKGMIYTLPVAVREQERLAGWNVLLYLVGILYEPLYRVCCPGRCTANRPEVEDVLTKLMGPSLIQAEQRAKATTRVNRDIFGEIRWDEEGKTLRSAFFKSEDRAFKDAAHSFRRDRVECAFKARQKDTMRDSSKLGRSDVAQRILSMYPAAAQSCQAPPSMEGHNSGRNLQNFLREIHFFVSSTLPILCTLFEHSQEWRVWLESIHQLHARGDNSFLASKWWPFISDIDAFHETYTKDDIWWGEHGWQTYMEASDDAERPGMYEEEGEGDGQEEKHSVDGDEPAQELASTSLPIPLVGSCSEFIMTARTPIFDLVSISEKMGIVRDPKGLCVELFETLMKYTTLHDTSNVGNFGHHKTLDGAATSTTHPLSSDTIYEQLVQGPNPGVFSESAKHSLVPSLSPCLTTSLKETSTAPIAAGGGVPGPVTTSVPSSQSSPTPRDPEVTPENPKPVIPNTLGISNGRVQAKGGQASHQDLTPTHDPSVSRQATTVHPSSSVWPSPPTLSASHTAEAIRSAAPMPLSTANTEGDASVWPGMSLGGFKGSGSPECQSEGIHDDGAAQPLAASRDSCYRSPSPYLSSGEQGSPPKQSQPKISFRRDDGDWSANMVIKRHRDRDEPAQEPRKKRKVLPRKKGGKGGAWNKRPAEDYAEYDSEKESRPSTSLVNGKGREDLKRSFKEKEREGSKKPSKGKEREDSKKPFNGSSHSGSSGKQQDVSATSDDDSGPAYVLCN
ncbi:hypothetical protein BOTBODRAFT_48822 [Botryobasidium botryosum FD-172 SS1]|uniref:Uncharacterized protein n=1 Tax=Botryobasidium botryosum (strain FD-172 SS1) TaxID=930990 RepID=A0A067LVM5_BOTB1|nr:hypothetical protein BOTBODRAFT_48822 [Botryobasidium botryosum FD-172 SS1]